ncbi:sigma-70 family RNA polymerase sigma factor [Saccharothrix variisporea]|uniref:RNA polymerase sigma-70 factor (ECF subfamily) n=1 Tax=Saccharothrix variisporea TaxID=543527 RepID=A0A495X4C8_9PSEU|nr:sigma-70 family RNA polymerase sigma factor [Saccharothrix variisporea]RKT67483.1 RNA polymerase sigma-70 factor (ECF subfamily) [Saccharothrix variisporea]
MDDTTFLAQRFDADRGHLRAVAYRMLGSMSEAEDAVQEAWLRLQRSDASEIGNLGGWLTTVVSRVCLDMLRSRTSRREDPLEEFGPEPATDDDPEHEAVVADSVGLALLVVLETLTPAERLAFVLHDLFGVAFEEIAPIVGRTPTAARQLASRARRRVRTGAPVPDDLTRQREVVGAFMAAARDGDFDALLAVLDPDVVLRVDFGALKPERPAVLHGAEAVARQAIMFSSIERQGRQVLVDGGLAVLSAENGVPKSLLGMTVSGGRIVAIHIVADPDKVRDLELTELEEVTEG